MDRLDKMDNSEIADLLNKAIDDKEAAEAERDELKKKLEASENLAEGRLRVGQAIIEDKKNLSIALSESRTQLGVLKKLLSDAQKELMEVTRDRDFERSACMYFQQLRSVTAKLESKEGDLRMTTLHLRTAETDRDKANDLNNDLVDKIRELEAEARQLKGALTVPFAGEITLSQYQRISRLTAIYPHKESPAGLGYVTLGLCGEAGEVAEKVKKCMRDDLGNVTPALRTAVKKELGDVLWYVAGVACELDLDLGEIGSANIDKLQGRKSRGTLGGSGDDR